MNDKPTLPYTSSSGKERKARTGPASQSRELKQTGFAGQERELEQAPHSK